MKILQKNYSQKEVVDGIRAESRNILAYVFKELIPVVGRVSGSILKYYNDEDVREITCMTLERFGKILKQTNQIDDVDYKRFCGGIAKNLAKQKRALKKPFNKENFEELVEGHETLTELIEINPIDTKEWRVVFEAFQKLSPECQEIIKLTDYCDVDNSFSYKEIGKMLNKTENNARQFKFSCMAKLKSMVFNKLTNLN